ncbi:ATP-binding protein [Coleofasciculus sp. FACHB-129]|uniref:ATP-binding protein n=1 Tax=Cyanophyceae TaxID=3028117 RepID=UPI001686D3A1|nr:ATP-binding protein [Coleofasciculus sp. FACHB-129]MBD1893660.1 PAS domain-containing protein [Coleofasciculus sp. FACHB-129]
MNASDNLELFGLFLQHTPTAVAMCDRQMRYLLASRQWLIDYGLDEQNLIGRSHYEVFPHLPDQWRHKAELVLSGASSGEFQESSFVCPDGSSVPIKWSLHPWKHPSGERGGLILSAEMIQSEDFFHSIYEGVENAIFVLDVDAQGVFRYLSWNRPIAMVTGISSAQAMGKTPHELFGLELGNSLHERYTKCLVAGECTFYEDCIPLQGVDTYWLTTLTPLRDAAGRIYRIIGTGSNISALKQVEEALRQSEARFRELAQREELLNRLASQIRSSLDLNTILETAVQEIRRLLQIEQCLFMWYRPNGESASWEILHEAKVDNLPSFLGCYPEEPTSFQVIQLLNREIIHLDNIEALTDPNSRQFFQSLGYVSILNFPIMTRTGELGVVACGQFSSPRTWHDDEVELLSAVCDQVAIAINQAELYTQTREAAAIAQAHATRLETTLQELQRTQSQLVQSEKMSSLGQLVAGVAHEINNSVNFIYGNLAPASEYTRDILGLLQLYQQQYPHPTPEIQDEIAAIDLDFLIKDLPKLLSSMNVGAERICEIVRSLRNFSRLDEAEMKLVDIHEGIESTLLILQNRFKSKPDHPPIQLIKEYGNLPKVECYPGQLNQVFMNLLTNAIDALDESNKKRSLEQIKADASIIRIRTDVLTNNRVAIKISDNGPGMAEEVRKRLFDPFFTTKPVGIGTGLGLSISYQIVVEKHGGQLKCISAPGQGAQFLIEIPLHPPSHI